MKRRQHVGVQLPVPATALCCTWSMHAYGKAIDINPVENPELWSGGISPTEQGRVRGSDRTSGKA